ncbi:MAG: EMC3/TMCO1 family protein [Candidatus Micrarchaeota archaeon]
MDLSTYIAIVAVIAIIYGFGVREIQNRLINKKEMEDVQKDSKRLSNEYNQAKKSDDKAAMDRIMKEQMEILPRMNKMMMGQLKPMLVITMVFLAVIWVVNSFNPVVLDDITVHLNDNGIGCDKIAADGIYSGCHNMTGASYGKWSVTAHALKEGNTLGTNYTLFYYRYDTGDTHVEPATAAPMTVTVDKKIYKDNEQVLITATAPPNALQVDALLDSGTEFRVDLPFTIPLINVKTIYQPYWWFISISLLFSLGFSAVAGMMAKKEEKK